VTANRDHHQAGLTLVELMIALLILSIAVAAAFSIGFTMLAGYRDSRRAVAVERSARGAIGFISKAVRAASPGVPTGSITDLGGCNTFSGLRVTNHDDAPDELEVIYASGAVVTSLRATFDDSSSSLTVLDGSAFSAGDYALVLTPGGDGHLVPVVSVSPSGSEYVIDIGGSASSLCGGVAPFTYAPPSMVLRARLAHFFVDDTGSPMLMMDPDGDGPADPEPVAEGIEDLQIAVGVDTDSDDTVTEVGAAAGDDEWFYNVAGDLDPPDVATTPWRALRLTVTARAVSETSAVADSLRPAAEDRPAASVADVFRRRTLSTTVEIRNLKGSP
jgi:prepilin-type N-terminal cleavage/methylation domain-containing protein